jgi:phage tail P2-like protein
MAVTVHADPPPLTWLQIETDSGTLATRPWNPLYPQPPDPNATRSADSGVYAYALPTGYSWSLGGNSYLGDPIRLGNQTATRQSECQVNKGFICTAMTEWHLIYPEAVSWGGAAKPSVAGTNVLFRNRMCWGHLVGGGWILLQQAQQTFGAAGQAPVQTGRFTADQARAPVGQGQPVLTFISKPAVGIYPPGWFQEDAPIPGNANHGWVNSRGQFTFNQIDGFFSTFDICCDQLNANLICAAGGDWWQNASAPFPDNTGYSQTCWRRITTDWTTVTCTSVDENTLMTDPPPPLVALASGTSPPPPPPPPPPPSGSFLPLTWDQVIADSNHPPPPALPQDIGIYPYGIAGFSWELGGYSYLGDTSRLPPAGWTSTTMWHLVYPEAASYQGPAKGGVACNVIFKNYQSWVHLKTGGWVQAQDCPPLLVTTARYDAQQTSGVGLTDGSNEQADGSFPEPGPPVGFANHGYPSDRGNFTAGAVDGVFSYFEVKVDQVGANLLVAGGIDWWQSESAPFPNNTGYAQTIWKRLTTSYQPVTNSSLPLATLQADPPPPLVGVSVGGGGTPLDPPALTWAQVQSDNNHAPPPSLPLDTGVYPFGINGGFTWEKGGETYLGDATRLPPSTFTGMTVYHKTYPEAVSYQGAAKSTVACNELLRNYKSWVHLKTGGWVQVQAAPPDIVTTGQTDPLLTTGAAITVTINSDGTFTETAPPAGSANEGWINARGSFTAGQVDGAFGYVELRVDQANANKIGMLNIDWWASPSTAPNQLYSQTIWKRLTQDWTSFTTTSVSMATLMADPPPPLVGLAPVTTVWTGSASFAPAAALTNSKTGIARKIVAALSPAAVMTATMSNPLQYLTASLTPEAILTITQPIKQTAILAALSGSTQVITDTTPVQSKKAVFAALAGSALLTPNLNLRQIRNALTAASVSANMTVHMSQVLRAGTTAALSSQVVLVPPLIKTPFSQASISASLGIGTHFATPDLQPIAFISAALSADCILDPDSPVLPFTWNQFGSQVLYPAASGLEKAMADTDTPRLIGIPAEVIVDTWDPYACPVELLPYLAWAMGVTFWNDAWSEQTKRDWIAAQWQFKSLRGTEAGVRMAVDFAGRDVSPFGYHVRDIITQPQGQFPSPGITPEQQEAWLASLPQVREYLFVEQGQAMPDEFYINVSYLSP